MTKDISVQCVFNNAGFIVTGFFESSSEGKQMANLECNATASAKVRRFVWSLSLPASSPRHETAHEGFAQTLAGGVVALL